MKQTIYIDQNIIQYVFEGVLKLPLFEDATFIYSDEHFREICRISKEKIDLKKNFLDTLKIIEARKIELELEDFTITDKARIIEVSNPWLLYRRFYETTKDTPPVSDIFTLLQPFFLGNTDSLNPVEHSKLLIDYLSQLMGDTEESKILPSGYTLNALQNEFEQMLTKAKTEILPIDKLRNRFLEEQLNNLDASKGLIVDQIWDLIRLDFKVIGIEKDQLFGKLPFPNETSDKKLSHFESIIRCHHILNTLGYYPDSGLSQIRKTHGINSDGKHIAYSSYCDGLLSADERLCKKATAIFGYFNIGTLVYQLKFHKEES